MTIKRLDIAKSFLELMFNTVEQAEYRLKFDGIMSSKLAFRHLKYNDRLSLEQLSQTTPGSELALSYPIELQLPNQQPVYDSHSSHLSYELACYSKEAQLKLVYEGLRLSNPESGLIAGAGILIYTPDTANDYVSEVRFVKRNKKQHFRTTDYPGDIISNCIKIDAGLNVLNHLKHMI